MLSKIYPVILLPPTWANSRNNHSIQRTLFLCSAWYDASVIVGVACVLSVVLFWSFTPVLIKISLEYVDPYTLAFLRLFQGLSLIVILWRKRYGTIRRMLSFEPLILVGGAGITVNYILFIVALNYTTAGMGGLIVQIQFVTLAALAWLVLGEPFHLLKLAGILVIVVGVSLVFAQTGTTSQITKSEYVVGNGLMLVAGIGWGVYAMANKAISARRSHLEFLAPIFVIATAVSFITSLLNFQIRAPMSIFGILAIVILGTVVTGVGFLLMSAGLRRLNASLVGAIAGTTPLFNLLAARWMLNEPLTPIIFLSACVILFGILSMVQADRLCENCGSWGGRISR